MIEASTGATVPVRTRAFVYGFLTVFVACGLFGLEVWPLTGWRLFSELRGSTEVGWEAVTVDGSGREAAVPFPDLPRGFAGGLQVMQDLASRPAAERQAACGAWALAVEDLEGGRPVAAVRVYRVERSAADGRERARHLQVDCRRGARW